MKTSAIETAVAIKNILFPTDFSRESMLALPYALAIARSYRSSVYAAHIDGEPLGVPGSVREGLSIFYSQRENHAADAMLLMLEHTRDVPFKMLFRKGDIWTELSDIIALKKIDLIITATHGRRGIAKLMEGSVAEIIFRQAACPVITVGPAVSGEPGSIADLHEVLFATDFSPESLSALPHAVSLARQDGARLYILHVSPEPLDAFSEAMLKEKMFALLENSGELACEPKVFVEYGPPAEAILEFAEEFAVDLVVMGVRRPPRYLDAGRSPRQSTAYAVATRSLCPLLTVRA